MFELHDLSFVEIVVWWTCEPKCSCKHNKGITYCTCEHTSRFWHKMRWYKPWIGYKLSLNQGTQFLDTSSNNIWESKSSAGPILEFEWVQEKKRIEDVVWNIHCSLEMQGKHPNEKCQSLWSITSPFLEFHLIPTWSKAVEATMTFSIWQ